MSRWIGFVLTSLLAVAAHCAQPLQPALQQLPDARFPVANKVVTGTLDASQIASLPRAGIRHIVNLRPAEEHPSLDEARVANEHGLEYHAIPIKGAQSLTLENAKALDRVLGEIGDEPTLLHCSSGNRVGALIAVREAWIKGKSPEEAVGIGKAWGLAGLEESVRALLEERP